MVSLFVPRDVLFQMAMKHKSFFTCSNSLEVFCPLIPSQYHMIKHQASRIHIKFGNPMRVVAMSLQMEIIPFIQEDHPSDGSSFHQLRHISRARAHGVHPITLNMCG